MGQPEDLQVIATNLQKTYESLRKAAANISGLLQSGQATCDEVKAYNLWALAIWNTQKGMLASLRAGGEPNIPSDPGAPTLFLWRGVSGDQAWQVDCSGERKSLSGLMAAAMKPSANTQYLSSNEMVVSTTDPYAYAPENAPSFAMLTQQLNTPAPKSLGVIPAVFILIGVVAVAVSIAIAAIMKFLEVNSVQKANTEQTALQAQAFANYTSARLECFKSCTAEGKSTEDCVDVCKKLVDKPNIKIPGLDEPWGMLQWIGFTLVVGVGTMVAWRIYTRKKAGKPIFQLPASVEDAMHPG